MFYVIFKRGGGLHGFFFVPLVLSSLLVKQKNIAKCYYQLVLMPHLKSLVILRWNVDSEYIHEVQSSTIVSTYV